MLRLPDFEYHQPGSVDEAVSLLADHDQGGALAVAGGTDVYPKMKRKQFRPDAVVSLADIEGMAGIRDEGEDGVVIGAQATLDTIANDPTIAARYPAVAEATGAVATPSIRRMGTIAGNLCQDPRCDKYDQPLEWRESVDWCWKAPGREGWPPEDVTEDDIPCRVAPGAGRCWANYSSDSAPALIAHGAEVTLVGGDGERTVPLAELFVDDGIDPLDKAPEELITHLRLPPANGTKSTYRKLKPRASIDFPEMGVAVAVEAADDGTVEDARIVFTAVGSCPKLADDAAEALVGEAPDGDLIEEVGQLASRATQPMDNTAYHPTYRKQMAAVYTERALGDLLGVEADA
ncbi:MAG: xanthine dehydrogenase family protein subunit M [Halobacteriales archaeon]